jgi:hypothetical protein
MILVKMDKEIKSNLLQVMLNQIKIDDPRLKKLIDRKLTADPKQENEQQIVKEIIRRLRIQNKKLLEQVVALRAQVKNSKKDKSHLLGKMERLVKLSNSLADAVGSCKQCWGENSRCPVCGGEGFPGWRKINKRLFNLYILPAIESKL